MAAPTGQKIRIRLKAYDHEVIDQSTKKIVETVLRTQAKVRGPVPLPDRDPQVHGHPLAARRQGQPRALRDAHPQAPHRHRRADRQDRRGAPAPRPPGRRRHRTEDAAGLTGLNDPPGPIARQSSRERGGRRRDCHRSVRGDEDDDAVPDSRSIPTTTRRRVFAASSGVGAGPRPFSACSSRSGRYEFIRLPMLRYDRFGTFGFDLGIYDQATSGCSRASTTRSSRSAGSRSSVTTSTRSCSCSRPSTGSGAGPLFLLSVQVVAQASGCDRGLPAGPRPDPRPLARGRAGRGPAAQPHLPMAHVGVLPSRRASRSAPLLFAYWAARNGALEVVRARSRSSPSSCKEDVALALAVIGLAHGCSAATARSGCASSRPARPGTSSSRPG